MPYSSVAKPATPEEMQLAARLAQSTAPIAYMDALPEGEVTETIELPDGGLEVIFGLDNPQPPSPLAGLPFDANLAEHLDSEALGKLAATLIEAYEADDKSREDWKEALAAGLKLLGWKDGDVKPAFDGGSTVCDPLLPEAIINFQARAIAELAPPKGPCRAIIMGRVDDEREAQRDRVETAFNWYCLSGAPEWEEDTDRLLMMLPMSGACYRKVYYDPMLQRPTSRYVHPEHIVYPYAASSFREAHRITHVTWLSPGQLKAMQRAGAYRDVEVPEPTDEDSSSPIKDQTDSIEGRTASRAEGDDRHCVLEMHVEIDLGEYLAEAEVGDDPDGIPLPYVVAIEKDTAQVLSLKRNWDPADDLKRRRDYFVEYTMFPGFGSHPIGLAHLLAGLQRGVSGSIRALLDSAAFANLQGGLRTRGLKPVKGDMVVAPGEWPEVDVPGDDIRKALLPLPYKEPSQTLMVLYERLLERGQRLAAISDTAVGDQTAANAPVGTVVALLEQATRVTSAVHKRLHRAQKWEFDLLSKLFRGWIEEKGGRYQFPMPSGEGEILASDFDDRVDILPVSDPATATRTQRVALAQSELQVASTAPPGMYDMRAVHRRFLHAIGSTDIDEIMPDQEEAQPTDPASENVRLLAMRPVKAGLWQDHTSHIEAHAAWLQGLSQNQMLAPVLPHIMQMGVAHIAEHMAQRYAVQIASSLGVDPAIFADPEQGLPPQVEGMIAARVAQETAVVAQQLGLQMAGGAGDPAVILAQAELKKAEAAMLSAGARADANEIAMAKAELEARKLQLEEAKAAADAGVDFAKLASSERIAAAKIQGDMQRDILKGRREQASAMEKERASRGTVDGKAKS